MEYAYLIKDGLVFDGEGTDAVKADIAIRDGRINLLPPGHTVSAKKNIDACGMVVSPGFVDCHSHSDVRALWDKKCLGKIMDGVTTEIIGNCGASAYPYSPYIKEAYREDFSMVKDTSWAHVDDFSSKVYESGSSINRGFLTGHGALRSYMAASEERLDSTEQIQQLAGIAEEELKRGALGISLGLIYAPGCYSDTKELLALARVVAESGGVLTSHIRSEGDNLLDSVDEALLLGRETGAEIQISHLKASGARNWGKLGHAIEKIITAREEGINIYADRYPFTASHTTLEAVLPKWAIVGDVETRIGRYSDVEQRTGLISALREMYPSSRFYDELVLASGVNDDWSLKGKGFNEISNLRGSTAEEAVLDILVDSRCEAEAFFFNMSTLR